MFVARWRSGGMVRRQQGWTGEVEKGPATARWRRATAASKSESKGKRGC